MRNLAEVIDQMLAVIPQDNNGLIMSLNSVKESFMFTSPETVGVRWDTTAEILGDNFPDKLENMSDWQLSVIKIWNPTLA